MASTPRHYGVKAVKRKNVSIRLSPDAYEALQIYAAKHQLKPSGAAHHLLRISLGLSPLNS